MDVLDRVKEELGQLADAVGNSPGIRNTGAATNAARLKHTAQFPKAVALMCQGLHFRQIAELLEIDHLTFRRNYLRNPTFQEMLKEANGELFTRTIAQLREQTESLQARAAALAEDALDKMEQLLHESPNEHIVFKVAQDALDRDPRISRTKRIEGTGATNLTLPPGTVLLAMQAAAEMEKSPTVRNITPTKGPLMSSPDPTNSPATPSPTPNPAPATIDAGNADGTTDSSGTSGDAGGGE